MTEDSISKQLKNLFSNFVGIEETSPKGFDNYCNEFSRILATAPIILSWRAYLQSDLWRLREAIASISQAYDEWKKGNMHYISGSIQSKENIWNPDSLSLNKYKENLFKLVESSIVAKKLKAIPIQEANDYWIIPIDLLIWCYNRNIILPAPYEEFTFLQSIDNEFSALDLELAKEAYENAVQKSNRRPDIQSLMKKREGRGRRDRDQMEEFLKVAKKTWARSPHLDKSMLLKHPAVVAAREKLRYADGRPKTFSDSYLKRCISKVAPNQKAHQPGRRKYAKSCGKLAKFKNVSPR